MREDSLLLSSVPLPARDGGWEAYPWKGGVLVRVEPPQGLTGEAGALAKQLHAVVAVRLSYETGFAVGLVDEYQRALLHALKGALVVGGVPVASYDGPRLTAASLTWALCQAEAGARGPSWYAEGESLVQPPRGSKGGAVAGSGQANPQWSAKPHEVKRTPPMIWSRTGRHGPQTVALAVHPLSAPREDMPVHLLAHLAALHLRRSCDAEEAPDPAARLALLFDDAQSRLWRASGPPPRGLSYSASVAALWLAGGRLALAHSGDGRILRYRDGEGLRCLTEEHSLGQLAKARGLPGWESVDGPYPRVVVRALGLPRAANAGDAWELRVETPRAEDVYLLLGGRSAAREAAALPALQSRAWLIEALAAALGPAEEDTPPTLSGAALRLHWRNA